MRLVLVASTLLGFVGCQSFHQARPLSDIALGSKLDMGLIPSHNREWTPDLEKLPSIDQRGDRITVRNIRNCVYESDDEYVVNYYNKRFDLDELETVDFIVVPFKTAPELAHTMLSFGFAERDFLAVSVEARLEQGERYSPVMGSLRQYELMYVIADERDVIVRRTQHRDSDVYVYRTTATPKQARALFLDVAARVNGLIERPEFYDTLTNNCTTNIVRHVNRLNPGRIPRDMRVLLPGASDQLAYQLGLLERDLPFGEMRRRAHVNELANRYASEASFSKLIRR